METPQPVMKRGRNHWDKINMPAAEFQERVARIKKEMKKVGMDVLLLYGSGVNDYGNTCYISNYFMDMAGGALAAIPAGGEAAFIFEGAAREMAAVKTATWIEELIPCGDIAKGCWQYLKDKNLTASKIGLAGLRHLMPYHQWRFFQEATKQARLVDAEHIIDNMRMVKSQKEVEQMRRSARILCQAFETLPDTPYPDMSERMIEAVAERRAYREGAEDFRILLAIPEGGKWAFRTAGGRQIPPGGRIIVYLAVEFERYWSEGIRTFIARPPHLAELKKGNTEALLAQIVGGMRAGKTVAQFYKETAAELEKSRSGYIPEYGLGQGIGLGLKELPIINESDETRLREGMCFTLRLLMKVEEDGDMMTGHTICLTKDRTEVLTG